MTTLTLAATLLAQNAPRDTGPDFGKASPVGLLLVVLLLLATFLLVRSMNKHLRKVPKSFDEQTDGPGSNTGDAERSAGADGSPPDADGTKREPGG